MAAPTKKEKDKKEKINITVSKKALKHVDKSVAKKKKKGESSNRSSVITGIIEDFAGIS